jgi:hypothetical protein
MVMLSVIAGINVVVDLIVGIGFGVVIVRVVVIGTIGVENTLHTIRNSELPGVASMGSVCGFVVACCTCNQYMNRKLSIGMKD